jgi:integrase
MKGTVEKYGSSWRIRYEAGLTPNGKRDQRSKAGFATKRAAQEALSEALEQVRRGVVADVRGLTVGAYLTSWLDGKRKLRPSTRRAYESHIRVYLVPSIGHVRLSALRADHLDAMYETIRSGQLRKPPGAATLRRIHATLHSALATAYKRRLITHNPAGQVELEPAPRNVRAVWTPSELATLLQHAAADRLGAAYHLVAATGLRRGELCGLRWADVDLDGGALVIRRQHVEVGREIVVGAPKTKAGARTVAVDSSTIAMLKAHKATQAAERLAWGAGYSDGGLVFAREDGTPLRPEYVTRHFVALSVEAGLPRIVLHGLRHTWATHALAAGVDMLVVSRHLGHSSLALTADTYTRVLPEVARQAAELVAAMVRQAAAADGAARV